MAEINSIPLQFDLKNEANGENALYTKGIGAGKQTLILTVANKSRGDIQIPSSTDTVSPEVYHLALSFPPGILQNPEQVGITPGDGNTSQWSLARDKDRAQSDCFYLLKTDASALVLAPDATLSFRVSNIDVDENGGSRNTTAELRYRQLSLAGQSLPDGFLRQYLSVLNSFLAGLSDLEKISDIDGIKAELIQLRDDTLPPLIVRPSTGWSFVANDSDLSMQLEIMLNPLYWSGVPNGSVLPNTGAEIQIRRGDDRLTINGTESASAQWTARTDQEANTAFVKITPTSGASSITAAQPLKINLSFKSGAPRATWLRLTCKNLKNAAGTFEDFDLILPLFVGPLGVVMPAAGNGKNAGIYFPENPGGGGSDAAWLRYYVREGEQCTLELGVANDSDDHIALMASGNVGIGTNKPGAKLDVIGGGGMSIDLRVNGRLKSDNDEGGLWIKDNRFVGGVGDKIGFWYGAWRLLVNASGNIGIGTSNPEDKLQIGDYSVDSSNYFSIRTGGGNRHRAGIRLKHFADYDGFTLESDERVNQFFIKRHSDTAEGVNALAIDRLNGNMGVGTTGGASAKLEVVGGGGTNIDLRVNGRIQSNNDDGGLWVKGDRFFGGAGASNMGLWNGNTWRVLVNNSGMTQLIGTSGDENTNGVLFVSAAGWPNLRMGVVNDGNEARGWIQTHGSKPLYLNTLGNDVIMNKQGGNVGIGIAGPRAKLDVNGNLFVNDMLILDAGGGHRWQIYAEKWDPSDVDLFFDYTGNPSNWASGWLEPMGSGWRNNSDASIKTNLEDIAGVLEKVLQLKPKKYHFIHEDEARPKHMGFIAQEVEPLFPDMVKEKRELKSLNYSDFGVLAIAAIQEQQTLIDQLKVEVAQLKTEAAQTKTDMEQMKANIAQLMGKTGKKA